MKMRNLTYASVALLVVGLVGCTKSGPQSSVQLAMPNWKSYAVKDARSGSSLHLTRVMINGTSSNSATPQILIWQANSDSDTSYPTTWSGTFDRGASSLVQVAAIYGSDDGDIQDQFYYGDVSIGTNTDLSKPLQVNLHSITQSVGSYTGVISGRYLSATGDGPTGLVDMKLVPEPGKPAMIVSQAEMHGGWFEFTAFEGMNFTYTLQGFGDIVTNFNLDNVSVLGGNRNMAVTIPAAHRSANNGGDATDPMKLVLGYFGPGSGGVLTHTMCYDANVSDSLTNLVDANSAPIAWGATNPSASVAGVVAGGAPSTSPLCANASLSLYTDYLKFDQTRLQDTHGALGFRGPYAPVDSSGSLYGLTASSGSANLTFNLLPGTVGPLRISGFDVFTRTVPTGSSNNNGHKDFEQDDLVVCNSLTTLAQPFAKKQRIPVSAAGAQSVTLANFDSTAYAAGTYQVLLCPYSANSTTYYQSALEIYSDIGGGSNSSSYDMSLTGPSNLARGNCGAFQVNYLVNGVATPAPAALSIGLSSNANNGKFYTTSNCSDSGTTSVPATFAAGSPSYVFYYQDSSSLGSLVSLNLNMPNGWGRSLLFASWDGPTSPSKIGLVLQSAVVDTSGTTNLATGLCYPLDVISQRGDGVPEAPPTTMSYALTSDTGATASLGQFYSDAACSTPNSSVTFDSTHAYKRLYFKPSSVSTAGYIKATISSGSGPSPFQISPMNVANSASAAVAVYGNLANSSYFNPNTCTQLRVARVATNGMPASTTTGSQQAVAITGDANVQFYTDNACTGPGLASISQTLYGGIDPNAITSTGFFVKMSGSSSQLTMNAGGTITNSTLYAAPNHLDIGPNATNFALNKCNPTTVTAQFSNSVITLPAPLTLSMTTSSGNFYSDASCSTPIPGNNLTVPAGQNSNPTIFMVPYASGTASLSVSVTGTNIIGNGSRNVMTPSSSAYFTLDGSSMASSMSVNSCIQVYFPSPIQASSMTFQILDTTNLAVSSDGHNSYVMGSSACSTSWDGGNGDTQFLQPISSGTSMASKWLKLGPSLTSGTPIFQIQDNSAGAYYTFGLHCSSGICTQ